MVSPRSESPLLQLLNPEPFPIVHIRSISSCNSPSVMQTNNTMYKQERRRYAARKKRMNQKILTAFVPPVFVIIINSLSQQVSIQLSRRCPPSTGPSAVLKAPPQCQRQRPYPSLAADVAPSPHSPTPSLQVRRPSTWSAARLCWKCRWE